MELLMRPGYTLLVAGLVSLFTSRFIDVVPLIGTVLSVMMFFFAIFAVFGGVWLIVAERRAART